jgi:hypothetical protein
MKYELIFRIDSGIQTTEVIKLRNSILLIKSDMLVGKPKLQCLSFDTNKGGIIDVNKESSFMLVVF